MPNENSNSKPWYKRLEVWGTVLQGTGALLLLFPAGTVAHIAGTALGIILGTGMQVKGALKGYRADNLYPGLSNAIDTLSTKSQAFDKFTGVRGSAKQ